jgi:hypothetical protein
MDGNNIFLIQQNPDGSFNNIPFASAGIGISGNKIVFLSENISFLSTGIRTGQDGSILSPMSYISGNPMTFLGQGTYDKGRNTRESYISIYDTDPEGNALSIQKPKSPKYANLGMPRSKNNNFLLNIKDASGIPIFAVKHNYSYGGDQTPNPSIGFFCNPDYVLKGIDGPSTSNALTISGSSTAIRFYEIKDFLPSIPKGKDIRYENEGIVISTNTNDEEGQPITFKNLEINTDGNFVLYKGSYAPNEPLLSTIDNYFTEDFEFSQQLYANNIKTNLIEQGGSGYLKIGKANSILEFDGDNFINLYKDGDKVLTTEDLSMTNWYIGASTLAGGMVTNSDISIQDNKFYPPTGTIPSSNYPGTQGEIKFDKNYVYFCKENNKWIRTALSEW